MRLMRVGASGQERPAALDGDGVIRDLSGVLSDITPDVLSPAGLAALHDIDLGALPAVQAGTRIGACISGVGKIVCIGRNYAEHARETGSEIPTEPMLFSKATTALSGPNDDIQRPRGSQNLDYEVELAIVIGTPAKYVAESDAMDHIAGYALLNDVSEREFQKKRQGQFIKGKSHDSFAPLGPWMVTRDEIADPQALKLWTDVNGIARQRGSTADMIFGVAHLVHYISQFMTLEPGDIIPTGTPDGVAAGMSPPGWLEDGDELAMGIDGLGEHRMRIQPAQ